MQELKPDFLVILRTLSESEVRFVLIGGLASVGVIVATAASSSAWCSG